MVTCQVNGVMLGTERFGDRSAPLILCVGGPTMPQSSPAGSATDPLIWPEWEWAGWSPRSPHSITRIRSQR